MGGGELPLLRRYPSGGLLQQGGVTALQPPPLNPMFPPIEANHFSQNLVKQPLCLPALKAIVQDTTTDPKPVFIDCFPLAPGP
jgi:hypothetical protein